MYFNDLFLKYIIDITYWWSQNKVYPGRPEWEGADRLKFNRLFIWTSSTQCFGKLLISYVVCVSWENTVCFICVPNLSWVYSTFFMETINTNCTQANFTANKEWFEKTKTSISLIKTNSISASSSAYGNSSSQINDSQSPLKNKNPTNFQLHQWINRQNKKWITTRWSLNIYVIADNKIICMELRVHHKIFKLIKEPIIIH